MQWLQSIKERLKPHAIPLTILCIVTLAVYAPSLQHEFLTNWDDPQYITSNEAVKGFTLSHISEAFSHFYVGNYAPIQILSYMLDYEIWGMNATGFILTNILIHLANGLMYYRILVMLAFSRLAAFVAAFIFLMHPVQVESAAWISQRKNLLAMLLFLMAFICYLLYARLPSGEKGRGRFYILSLTAFIGALLAKAVAVVLPVVLLLYDFCYMPGEETKKRSPDKIPFILLALLVGIVTLLAQQPNINNSQAGGRVPYHGGSLFNTLLTMMPVVLLYLKLLLFPFELSAAYPLRLTLAIDMKVMCGVAALMVMIAIGIRLFRQRRDLGFWYALIFIGLAPVSQIIPLITLINDRYLYFPMLGVAALAGYGLAKLCPSHPFTESTTAGVGRLRLACVLMLLLLLVLPWLSLKRATVWQNSITLWNDTAGKFPYIDTWLAQANAYHGNNDLKTAKQLYKNILEKDPTNQKTLYNLAIIYMEENNFKAARPLLQTLTEAHPDFSFGFVGLGNNYYMSGEVPLAEKSFRMALTIQSDLPQTLLPLGNILLARRELKEADFYLTKALRLDAKNPDLLYSLACLRSLEGNASEALIHLDTALTLGFRNKKNILSNKELNNIRQLPEFKALFSRYFP